MTNEEMFNLVTPYESLTIRQYLKRLLFTLWSEGEGFSGKRPFGDSGWEYDLRIPLIQAGVIKGDFSDKYGLNECDSVAGDKIIFALIEAL